MRELTRREVVAMWLFSRDYARSGLSAVEWCEQLGEYHSRLVDDFISDYESARKRDVGAPTTGGET